MTETWTDDENRALVEFLLFYGPEDTWPSHSKSSRFWSEASLFVQQNGGSSAKRTGTQLTRYPSKIKCISKL